MNAKELYEAGNLTEAVTAATDEVKRKPTDINARAMLAEFLSFAGQLERADKALDVISTQDPQAAVGVALFRQLIRAEQARAQFFSEGRVPELLSDPSAVIKAHLEASVCIRDGEPEKAAQLLGAAEAERVHVSGTADGLAFDDFRDADDLTSAFIEVLTSTGKYYWVPMEKIQEIELRKPKRPRDLLWRPAAMTVQDGPEGEVFLPTLYAGSHEADDDRVRLGRYTDWLGGEGSPVRGQGLRTFLVGEEGKTLLELEHVTFHTAGEG